MLAFVVLWNLLFFVAHQLNGGAGPLTSATPALTIAVACFGLALVGLGGLTSERVRAVVLRPTADFAVARPGLMLSATVGVLLFLALLRGCLRGGRVNDG